MAIVCSTRVFAVDVEKIPGPDGRTHEVATVRHAPCVVMVPVLDDGRIVLIRQYRHSVQRTLWELPAGSINPGEAPEDAAKRECEEETKLAPSRVEKLASMFPASLEKIVLPRMALGQNTEIPKPLFPMTVFLVIVL